MSTFAKTKIQTTLILNGYQFKDTGNGDFITLEPEGDRYNTDIASSGTIIAVSNPQGKRYKMTVKVIVGSKDYQFFINEINADDNDPVGTPPLEGSYTRSVRNDDGVVVDTSIIKGGVIITNTSKVSNASGDVEQAFATFVVSCSMDNQIG